MCEGEGARELVGSAVPADFEINAELRGRTNDMVTHRNLTTRVSEIWHASQPPHHPHSTLHHHGDSLRLAYSLRLHRPLVTAENRPSPTPIRGWTSLARSRPLRHTPRRQA